MDRSELGSEFYVDMVAYLGISVCEFGKWKIEG